MIPHWLPTNEQCYWKLNTIFKWEFLLKLQITHCNLYRDIVIMRLLDAVVWGIQEKYVTICFCGAYPNMLSCANQRVCWTRQACVRGVQEFVPLLASIVFVPMRC